MEIYYAVYLFIRWPFVMACIFGNIIGLGIVEYFLIPTFGFYSGDFLGFIGYFLIFFNPILMVVIFANALGGLVYAEINYIKKGKYYKEQFNYMLFQAGWVFIVFAIIYLFELAAFATAPIGGIIGIKLLVFLGLGIMCFVIYHVVTKEIKELPKISDSDEITPKIRKLIDNSSHKKEYYNIKKRKTCINCGNELFNNDNYCEKCGTKQ